MAKLVELPLYAKLFEKDYEIFSNGFHKFYKFCRNMLMINFWHIHILPTYPQTQCTSCIQTSIKCYKYNTQNLLLSNYQYYLHNLSERNYSRKYSHYVYFLPPYFPIFYALLWVDLNQFKIHILFFFLTSSIVNRYFLSF